MSSDEIHLSFSYFSFANHQAKLVIRIPRSIDLRTVLSLAGGGEVVVVVVVRNIQKIIQFYSDEVAD
jgi:hypothetical protein